MGSFLSEVVQEKNKMHFPYLTYHTLMWSTSSSFSLGVSTNIMLFATTKVMTSLSSNILT